LVPAALVPVAALATALATALEAAARVAVRGLERAAGE